MTRSPLEFSLRALLTADHAEVVNGKLYANGAAWTRFGVPVYPHVLPGMAVIAVLEVPFGHYNADHTFVLTMEDPDGQPLPVRAEGSFRVGAAVDMEYGEPTIMPFAIPIHNLVFFRPGSYAFVFAVDGTELGRFNVRAVQVPVPLMFNLAPLPEAPPETGTD
jgi:hypothetical protein